MTRRTSGKMSSSKMLNPELQDILKESANKFCADCGQRKPSWASVTLGTLICTQCAGIHRSLGTHISFVQSCNIDKWKPQWLEMCRKVGNEVAKFYYEHDPRVEAERYVPTEDVLSGGDTLGNETAAALTKWIRAKYEEKRYAHPKQIEPNLLVGKGLDPREVYGLKHTTKYVDSPQKKKKASSDETKKGWKTSTEETHKIIKNVRDNSISRQDRILINYEDRGSHPTPPPEKIKKHKKEHKEHKEHREHKKRRSSQQSNPPAPDAFLAAFDNFDNGTSPTTPFASTIPMSPHDGSLNGQNSLPPPILPQPMQGASPMQGMMGNGMDGTMTFGDMHSMNNDIARRHSIGTEMDMQGAPSPLTPQSRETLSPTAPSKYDDSMLRRRDSGCSVSSEVISGNMMRRLSGNDNFSNGPLRPKPVPQSGKVPPMNGGVSPTSEGFIYPGMPPSELPWQPGIIGMAADRPPESTTAQKKEMEWLNQINTPKTMQTQDLIAHRQRLILDSLQMMYSEPHKIGIAPGLYADIRPYGYSILKGQFSIDMLMDREDHSFAERRQERQHALEGKTRRPFHEERRNREMNHLVEGMEEIAYKKRPQPDNALQLDPHGVLMSSSIRADSIYPPPYREHSDSDSNASRRRAKRIEAGYDEQPADLYCVDPLKSDNRGIRNTDEPSTDRRLREEQHNQRSSLDDSGHYRLDETLPRRAATELGPSRTRTPSPLRGSPWRSDITSNRPSPRQEQYREKIQSPHRLKEGPSRIEGDREEFDGIRVERQHFVESLRSGSLQVGGATSSTGTGIDPGRRLSKKDLTMNQLDYLDNVQDFIGEAEYVRPGSSRNQELHRLEKGPGVYAYDTLADITGHLTEATTHMRTVEQSKGDPGTAMVSPSSPTAQPIIAADAEIDLSSVLASLTQAAKHIDNLTPKKPNADEIRIAHQAALLRDSYGINRPGSLQEQRNDNSIIEYLESRLHHDTVQVIRESSHDPSSLTMLTHTVPKHNTILERTPTDLTQFTLLPDQAVGNNTLIYEKDPRLSDGPARIDQHIQALDSIHDSPKRESIPSKDSELLLREQLLSTREKELRLLIELKKKEAAIPSFSARPSALDADVAQYLRKDQKYNRSTRQDDWRDREEDPYVSAADRLRQLDERHRRALDEEDELRRERIEAKVIRETRPRQYKDDSLSPTSQSARRINLTLEDMKRQMNIPFGSRGIDLDSIETELARLQKMAKNTVHINGQSTY